MGCSTKDFPIREGDTLPPLITKVTTVDPVTLRRGPPDFTTWTGLTFTMTGAGRKITGVAVGDALGTLTYNWAIGDTNAPGIYSGWFSGISPNGKPQTFPTRREDDIIISVSRL